MTYRPIFQKFLDKLEAMEAGKAWRYVTSIIYSGAQGFTDEEKGILINRANELQFKTFGREV
jgi:hypothetical protein